MSREGFDELLVKRLQQEDFEYNPAHWDRLAQLLPPAGEAPAADKTPEEFDAILVQKLGTEEFTYTPALWEQLSQMLPASEATVPAQDRHIFDKQLVNRIGQEELPYVPAHWEQLSRMLPPVFRAAGNGRKWAIAAGIAAALVLAAVFLARQLNKTSEDNGVPALVQQPPVQPGKDNLSLTPPAGDTQQATQQQLVQQGLASPVPQRTPYTTVPPAKQSPAPQQDQPVQPSILQPEQPQIAGTKDPAPAPLVPQEQKGSGRQSQTAKDPQEQYAYSHAPNPALSPSLFYEGGDSRKANARTSVALGGGVNYGNLNTGYSAGVSVRHKMGNDFFVDGAVAMMYNNNPSNVAANNGPPLQDNNSKMAARPAAFSQTNLASPALDPIQKLYYVQFNPSIGYQPEKHVALSIGGDFQQLLNKSSEIVQPESANSKVLPNFDIGLTAKSEFAITPSIQAGVVYREGLNNLLKNEGGKYMNRRYIQVQFKYSLPVN